MRSPPQALLEKVNNIENRLVIKLWMTFIIISFSIHCFCLVWYERFSQLHNSYSCLQMQPHDGVSETNEKKMTLEEAWLITQVISQFYCPFFMTCCWQQTKVIGFCKQGNWIGCLQKQLNLLFTNKQSDFLVADKQIVYPASYICLSPTSKCILQDITGVFLLLWAARKGGWGV